MSCFFKKKKGEANIAPVLQVFVRKVIELHDKYLVYVNKSFQNHTLFHKVCMSKQRQIGVINANPSSIFDFPLCRLSRKLSRSSAIRVLLEAQVLSY